MTTFPTNVPTTLQTEWISLDVNGSEMEAYWAHPTTEGSWPCVLVFMEIFGVNSHIREVTERIAAEGYHALAMNYYHRTTPNMELSYTEKDVEIGRIHKDQTTREGLITDTKACIEFLNQQPDTLPNFGAIGFCFGGHAAYLVATLPEIKATASFYAGGVAVMSPGGGAPTITLTPEIKGKILCLFGKQDPLIPLSQTVEIEKALSQAGIPHEVVRYSEAGHGFFCNQRADYNPHAAADAWGRVKTLFKETLSPA